MTAASYEEWEADAVAHVNRCSDKMCDITPYDHAYAVEWNKRHPYVPLYLEKATGKKFIKNKHKCMHYHECKTQKWTFYQRLFCPKFIRDWEMCSRLDLDNATLALSDFLAGYAKKTGKKEWLWNIRDGKMSGFAILDRLILDWESKCHAPNYIVKTRLYYAMEKMRLVWNHLHPFSEMHIIRRECPYRMHTVGVYL